MTDKLTRRAAAGAVAAAGALLLSACAGSDYQYVKNSSEGAYFKVPKDWKVYDKDDIVEASGSRLSPSQEDTLRFMVAFDGDPRPSLEHDLQTATRPFGLARVRQLAPDERQQFSLIALRNEIVPIDQILEEDAGEIELLQEPKDIVTSEGFAGTRLVYRVTTTDGSFTVDQTGLTDAQTRRVYFFIIGCESKCYDQNKRTITEIADSWTVKER
ncbi:MAG: hypothetical protein ACLGI2_11830 [Acidimicrobiia bacterium]